MNIMKQKDQPMEYQIDQQQLMDAARAQQAAAAAAGRAEKYSQELSDMTDRAVAWQALAEQYERALQSMTALEGPAAVYAGQALAGDNEALRDFEGSANQQLRDRIAMLEETVQRHEEAIDNRDLVIAGLKAERVTAPTPPPDVRDEWKDAIDKAGERLEVADVSNAE